MNLHHLKTSFNIIAGTGFLTPYFMKTPYISYPPTFQILPTNSPPPSTNSTPTALFVTLFLHHNWYVILCNYIMDLKCGVTIIPKGLCCVLYATRHKVYWGLTYCGFLLVLCFDITHTQRRTAHTEANRLTRPYKYIFTMCLQQLSVLHLLNNLLISKIYFPEFHRTLQKLRTLLIRFTKTKLYMITKLYKSLRCI